MIDTHRWRRRVLEYSATSALIDASMPPIPRPVTMRQTDSCRIVATLLAMNMPTVIRMTQPMIVGRRPIRSARPPRKIEPNAMPKSSIDKTMPSPARSMPHSAAMPGEAKLIDITSNPSSAFRATVSATTRICSRLIRDCAMVSRGSIFTQLSLGVVDVRA